MNIILKEHLEQLEEIIDCINVGVYITDGSGNTLTLNCESEKTGSLQKHEVIGQNMRTLTEKGFVKESATLKTLASGKKESFVQNLGDGGRVFITATPFYRNGKIEFVICTERDITETAILHKILEETEQMKQRYKVELEYMRNKTLDMQGDVVACSNVMKILISKARKIAQSNATVLLTGQSGTGKEIFANLIYKSGKRMNRPFIKVNCAAIPENLLELEFFGYEKGAFTGAEKAGKIGFFEMADTGTLFLDEIGELPIHVQSKLLRVLQEKEIRRIGSEKVVPVNVRIIAATNIDLLKAIERGQFRADLYYRLNVVQLEIPPLCQRKEDVAGLANYFTNYFSKEYKLKKILSYEAINALQEYDWPGNVRELKNMIERIVVSFDGVEITAFQVGFFLDDMHRRGNIGMPGEGSSLDEMMDNYERRILEGMMRKYKTASAVCDKLNVNKSTMSRKLKKYKMYECEEFQK